MMLEHQSEGIAKAERYGRYKGRKPMARRKAAEIAALKVEGVTPSEIAAPLGSRQGERVPDAGDACCGSDRGLIPTWHTTRARAGA